ncbi:MAG: Na+/H+ antiporter NhaA [Pseudomonadota bacterium]|jgi:NhaA family Na+:H+ antiporter
MVDKFFKSEASSGVLLLAVTVLALIVANAPVSNMYFDGLHATVAGLSLHHWINDGLMALFFLLVGLEIRHELGVGQLSTWAGRALPGFAALGGMVVPAAIYAAFNWGGALQGWAIPTATDIAFSLGVLAMLGSRAPASLKIFLTALAIIDDLGAVLIIALFYGSGLSPLFLGLAGALLALLIGLNRMGVKRLSPYLLLGAVLWFLVLKSGIHATIAGVLLAFVIPTGRGAHSPARKLEEALAGPVAFGIVPLFAFANAGVSLAGITFATFAQPITFGVAAGLFIGKQIGIFGACWLGVKSGLARLPAGTGWAAVYGVSLLCGIGFTISLFIGALAFPDESSVAAAKLGVIAGSFISGVGGWLVLSRTGVKR